MQMPKSFRGSKIPIILIIAAVLMFGTNDLLDANRSIESPIQYQTVPIRTDTPTPRPPGPSPTPDLSPPTQTEILPGPTVILVLTPEGGFFPTAVPCTEPPTIRALDTVNVRTGPGSENEVFEQLVFLEVRPIIGRSQYTSWWLIELRDNSNGWVIDEVVAVSGYIGNVPIADLNSVGDQTSAPTSTWAPTVEPQCTPLPTHTVTPSPTKTPAQETAGPEVTRTTTETPAAEEIPQTPTEDQETLLSAEAPVSPSPEKTTSIDVSQEVTEGGDSVSEAAGEGFNFNLLLFIGLGLILVGIVIYLGRRFTS